MERGEKDGTRGGKMIRRLERRKRETKRREELLVDWKKDRREPMEEKISLSRIEKEYGGKWKA